jgi:hypothetical protein
MVKARRESWLTGGVAGASPATGEGVAIMWVLAATVHDLLPM